MQAFESKYWQEGIDSKALLVCFLRKLPYLLLMGVAGAFIGSGLYLLIAIVTSEGPLYQAETEYYIDFADGRLEAKDHYNDFTWNDVIATDLILGNMMEILGASYERNAIKEMITADILSDVRYLTITIKGSDSTLVGAVSEAMKLSLELFGSSKEEFDSIDQIENNGVQQVEEKLFTWRAALLGVVCGVLVGVFWIAASFSLGSRFYTKRSISQCFGIPVFGLFYAKDNQVEGAQEKALQLALQYRMEKESVKKVVIADVVEGNYAQKCTDTLMSFYREEQPGVVYSVQGFFISKMEDFDAIRQTNGVILAIPFAKSCRESVIEKINQLENQDCKVLGAILVDVDKKWMKMYAG